MKNSFKNKAISAKKISFAALFAALCCIGTIVIAIPLATGYFNVGDVFVMLAGWCLGPIYGTLAAAIGSGLADIISGYTIYAPATFLIKGAEAFLAYFIWFLMKKIIKGDKWDILPRSISAVVGGFCMAIGYFLYELALYGFGGATAALIGNFTQGVCGAICAICLIAALFPIKGVKKLFPALTINKE